MKKRDLSEHRNKSLVDLRKEEGKLRERLASLRFDLSAGKVKNIKEIRKVQKSIAQILTVIKERDFRG